ncbi:molybdopterin dinucleotide binding domain-containing protein [Streptomyces sp. GS7]|uniref:molybdopterin dinucleotide binding domain-containing protein n=1 Tax=Streptomyces sp. GS7 TaxID=2692234 RepID=UPI002E2993E3|nr:molybdopterin dinucleotide binding domain-containing protein [Streptomyces sp. GS7]
MRRHGLLRREGGRHFAEAERELGVDDGSAAAGGSVSLQAVRCLGHCYTGPAALDGETPWPCPDADRPGEAKLYTGRFATADGRAHLASCPYLPPGEQAADDYPLITVTRRRPAHSNSGSMTRRTTNLLLESADWLDLHPDDADRYGLRDGDPVKVESRHGEARLLARVSGEVNPGQVFSAFHFPANGVNRLTSSHADPVRALRWRAQRGHDLPGRHVDAAQRAYRTVTSCLQRRLVSSAGAMLAPSAALSERSGTCAAAVGAAGDERVVMPLNHYVKSCDEITPVPRPDKERKDLYASVLDQTALRAVYELFSADTEHVVRSIALNGRVATIDRATGREVPPCLVSLQTVRDEFEQLVLTQVDPRACLKRPRSLVSLNP